MNQAQRNIIRQRHERVVATIERQLSANGFQPLRLVSHRDSDTDHYDRFDFWGKDARLLLTHRRFAAPACTSPLPLFDLYIPLDTSNDMEQTRLAIERYAQPQAAPHQSDIMQRVSRFLAGFADSDEEGVAQLVADFEAHRNTLESAPPAVLQTQWSLTPTAAPVTILEGDSYESRDVACARCGAKYKSAPWPNQEALCFRPRCSACGSSFTYPLSNPPTANS